MGDVKDYFFLLWIVGLCFLFCYLGRDRADHIPEPTKKVETDTVRRFLPPVVDVARLEPFTANLPRLLFVEHHDTVEVVRVDSVLVEVEMESRTYRDSTFEARVSGPSIAGRGPTLDYFHTYNTTTTITRTEFPRKWWSVRAGVGATFRFPTGNDLFAEVAIDRYANRWSYGASVGYTLSGDPYVEARGSFALFTSK